MMAARQGHGMLGAPSERFAVEAPPSTSGAKGPEVLLRRAPAVPAARAE